jgi:rfaE bifunctional protein kinase chain/domain
MDEKRIKEIAEKFKKVKVAIYGDYCLDAYWILDPRYSEVSVETGLMGQAVRSQYYNLGGASNIAANLAALKPKVISTIGVIGNDIFGKEILRQFKEFGINTEYMIIQNDGYDTVAFGKRYLNGKEKNRIDFGFFNKMTEETEERIISHIDKALEESDAFILNQQVPNSINSPILLERINGLIKKHSDKIVLSDTRDYGHVIKNTYRKLNEQEAVKLAGLKIDESKDIDIATIEEISSSLFKESKKPVFITRGSRGLAVAGADGFSIIEGIQILKEIDPVGAGDTVVSAIALCLASKLKPGEAAIFANIAASVTVKKLFKTGTASASEIMKASSDIRYIYLPELAEDIRKSKYLKDSEFELCTDLKTLKIGKIKHVIFDHDGTISVLRQGWEKIIEDVMVKSICGDKYQDIDLVLLGRIKKRVHDYIDKSTLQMEELVEMVKEFNLVQENMILDKFGYKKIYNNELMKMINKRIEKIESYELNFEDFIIKGAIKFLQRLKDLGISLYLTSGTDKKDVEGEAKILGYGHLFGGGIYGALDDVKKFSKKMVIEKIIEENHLKGRELAVFGDGPVEMYECRRNGGVAIGIASDETRRYGLNIEKRERLIKSGAHMVIPDFSQYIKLLGLLFQ